ncbi:hypothetical protein HK098_005563 [Nowakowskiella sp. JEL0407]|nr:hypothetical protein HK098_005563 [Nowakowskiella sp. JEL0407]
MCVIFFATNFAGYKLVVAANRDEFLDRPTKEAHYWELYPDVLAGIDLGHKQGNFQKYFGKKPQEVILSEEIENDSESELQTQLDKPPVNGHSVDDDLGHGTWLGISRTGRFAFITNFREHISTISPTAASRGYIVRDFLINSDEGDSSKSYSEKFITNLLEHRSDYNGFNIVVGEIGKETWYLGNRGDALKEGGRKLTEGIVHGFSNDILRQEGSEGWPKVETGKGLFEDAINTVRIEHIICFTFFIDDAVTFAEHRFEYFDR